MEEIQDWAEAPFVGVFVAVIWETLDNDLNSYFALFPSFFVLFSPTLSFYLWKKVPDFVI